MQPIISPSKRGPSPLWYGTRMRRIYSRCSSRNLITHSGISSDNFDNSSTLRRNSGGGVRYTRKPRRSMCWTDERGVMRSPGVGGFLPKLSLPSSCHVSYFNSFEQNNRGSGWRTILGSHCLEIGLKGDIHTNAGDPYPIYFMYHNCALSV